MVKISNKILLAGGLATAIGLAACGKYEDGPNFSLLTKKQRLTGDWDVKKLMDGGTDLTSNGFTFDMEFDKDGDFEFRSSYSGYYGSASNVVSGDWEFSSDKEEIELNFDDGDYQEIEITRLTNKELEGELSEVNKKKIFPHLAASKGNASLSSSRFEAEKR